MDINFTQGSRFNYHGIAYIYDELCNIGVPLTFHNGQKQIDTSYLFVEEYKNFPIEIIIGKIIPNYESSIARMIAVLDHKKIPYEINQLEKIITIFQTNREFAKQLFNEIKNHG